MNVPSVRAALLGALILAGPGHADMEDVEIGAEQLADNVWMLTGRGGNLGVSVGDDGVFLIDDQFAPLTEKIRAKIAELGGGEVRFVLNTHFHGDHTSGNENFAELGAVVIAHENVRRRMGLETLHPLQGTMRPPAPEANWPLVTFRQDVTFWFNGDEVRVFHVSGAHTDGDAIVHFVRANVIHVGDVVFSGMYPFIDWGANGHVDGVIRAVEQILPLTLADTRIIPGHGPVTDAKGLRKYRDMLRTVSDRVREAVASGKPLEEIQAARPTEEFDEEWGNGFIDADTFVKLLHAMITR